MKHGYIAITTVIILSVIITVLGFSLATRSYYSRLSSLGTTSKQQSDFAARSCLEQALLNRSLDNSYTGNETVTITTPNGTLLCTIFPFLLQGNNLTIRTDAVINQATTNYELVVDSITLSRISMQEVTTQ